MHHDNSGKCPRCKEIIDLYPNFYPLLRLWFEELQAKHPEAHVSCAGRGKQAQEDARNHKLSRAHWGESAHNWNIALDLFVIQPGVYIYDKTWFNTVLEPNLIPAIDWYGRPGSRFEELPHVEWRSWRDLKANKEIELVEQVVYPGDID